MTFPVFSAAGDSTRLMPDIPELLRSAAAWCRSGQFGPAQQAYQQVLQLDPGHGEALQQMGLIAYYGGRPDVAVEYLRRASAARPADADCRNNLGVILAGLGHIRDAEAAFRDALQIKPDSADAHNNLGNALREQGRPAEAAEAFRAALRLKPDFAEAHNNLGNVLCEQGRLAEGEAAYREAVRLQPGYSEAHANLGDTLREQGRPAEAEAAYREVVRLQPRRPEAFNSLANALRERGQLAEAEAACREALRLRPGFAEAHANLGSTLREQGRLAEAEATFREALRLRPNFAEAHNNLGHALCEQGRLAEGESAYREALRLRPNFAEAHTNRGNVLRRLGRPAEAEAEYREALRLRPGSAEAHSGLGIVLYEDNRLADGEASYREALRRKPDYAEAHNNLAMLLLSRGQYGEGWAEYEWRFPAHGIAPRDLGRPAWDGSPLGGTLLLWAEQGLGDTLQFVRYAALARERAGAVVLRCPPALAPLLSRCVGVDRVVGHGSPLPAFDAHAPLLSLPHLLGTTLESVPAAVPYLSPDPERVRQWQERLRPLSGFRIGIAWRGSKYSDEQHRSLPLRSFAPLAALPGVRLVSLQKGAGSDQLAEAAELAVADLGEGVDEAGAFVDTAAVMQNLDLVVTADTAIAHLAGALGVPTWVALPYAPNWRWLLDREDSPWYPTARLFRQARRGDWDTVFRRMADALRERLGGAAPPQPTPSPAGSEPEVTDSGPRVAELLRSAAECRRLGQLGQAEQVYRQVLQLDPGQAEALEQLGLIAYAGGRLGPAVDHLRRAAAARPDDAEWRSNLGVALAGQGRAAEAEAAFREALRLRPGYPEAHNNLGNILREQNRFGEAEAAYREALRLRPDYADALTNLATVLYEQGRFAEAEVACRAALRLQPASAEAYSDLGNTLSAQDRTADAVVAYREAVRLRPGYAPAYHNLGNVLRLQDQLAEAEAAYREAVRLKPDYADAHNNLGMLLLSQGRFAEGCVECEWRWRVRGNQAPPRLDRPAWDGGRRPGRHRTVLLYTEQGMGDTLQFVRYAALVQKRVGTVLLGCPPTLAPLLARCPGIDRIVGQGGSLPPYDAHAALPSLPRLLGTTLQTIPAPVPYLSADPELARRWRDELSALPGFKIGIAWQGNPKMAVYDRRRSFPLAALAPLAQLPGVHLVSLQKGPGREQLAAIARDWPLTDLGGRLDESSGAFMDTAAVVEGLDLVVSCDSSLAHLAGALGRPCWVALPRAADWRWLLGREDSPWYPTLRLFRQDRPGDWAGVFGRMAEALRERLK